ncbi:hypothetical protein ACQRIT_003085 [Beauveria bassiana]
MDPNADDDVFDLADDSYLQDDDMLPRHWDLLVRDWNLFDRDDDDFLQTDDVFPQNDKGLTIAQHAQQCIEAFKTCTVAPQTKYHPFLWNADRALFNAWVHDVKFLGPPDVSLDDWLRDGPTSEGEQIHKLLNVIEGTVMLLARSGRSAKTPTIVQRRTSESGQEDAAKTLMHSSETDGEGDEDQRHVDTTIPKLSKAVMRLRALSNKLRQSWMRDMENADVYIWECRAPSHPLRIFHREDELKEHFRTYHEIPEAHVQNLSDAARRPNPQNNTDHDEAMPDITLQSPTVATLHARFRLLGLKPEV